MTSDDPGTAMMAISTGMSAVRTFAPIIAGTTQAAGSVMAGSAAAEAERYNAEINLVEAELAERAAAREDYAAEIARKTAGIEAARVREIGAKTVSSQVAAAARSGIVATTGSPLLAELDTIRRAESDAVMARWKGDVAAWGSEEQAMQERIRAKALRTSAAQRRSAARGTLLRGLLTGAGDLAGGAYKTDWEKIRGLTFGRSGPLAGSGVGGTTYQPLPYVEYQTGF